MQHVTCMKPYSDHVSEIEIELVETYSQLVGLKNDWDRLLTDWGNSNLFLSHGYISAWWQAFGSDGSMQLYIFRADSRIIGIAPLLKSRWSYFGVPIRRLSFFQNHHFLRGDLLLPFRSDECLEALLKELYARRYSWDLLSFENVSPESPLINQLPSLVNKSGLLAAPWRPGRVHWRLPFNNSWDEYVTKRSKKFRWQMRHYQKRMDALGDCRFRSLTQRGEQLAWLEEMFELEQLSWKGNTAEAAMAEQDRLFTRALYESLDNSQLGPVWLIERKGQTVASINTLGHGQTLYAMTTYYAPEYRDISPGTLVIKELLASVWSGPWQQLDFNGDTPFIHRWAQESEQHQNIKVFSGNLYGSMLGRGNEWLFRARSRGARNG